MDEKPEVTDDESKRITFVLNPTDAERLALLAQKRRTTISQIVREIVGAELDRLIAVA